MQKIMSLQILLHTTILLVELASYLGASCSDQELHKSLVLVHHFFSANKLMDRVLCIEWWNLTNPLFCLSFLPVTFTYLLVGKREA